MMILDSTEVRAEGPEEVIDWGTLAWSVVNALVWIWVASVLWHADWLWFRILL